MVKKLYKEKKVKWGIAGCGRFAENSFLPAITFNTKRHSYFIIQPRY